jgi:NAD(P)-dependent dehydrogenase (short-subunit alcohol dehydrogenase family)
MSTNFQGKVIAITGAASGIGLAAAKMLASRGAILSLGDMNDALLQSITKDIASTGGKAFATALDVRKRSAVEAWISETVKREGRLDGAVNLAGVVGKQIGVANIEDIEDDDWDFVVGINLGGVLNCMRAEIKAMGNPKEGRRGASIVNASSIAGIIGLPKNGAYIASKHAVVGLTRAAAKECGGKGIRVNAIAP